LLFCADHPETLVSIGVCMDVLFAFNIIYNGMYCACAVSLCLN
jgi:hypothetical protein